jgi:DNA polymerase beta
MDYRPILIDQLGILEKAERQAKNPFKARAYGKVLREIKGMPEGPLRSADIDRVLGLPGVGEKLAIKVREIFQTGELHQAKEVVKESAFGIGNALLKIYGVGPVKARELVRTHGIRSLDDLRIRADELLNDKQRIGLVYYDDLNTRIPREEMKQHERLLKNALHDIDPKLKGEVVGSFRRGASDSGDVDFLVCLPGAKPAVAAEVFQRLIQYLMGGLEYLTELLAVGPKKCMGIGRLHPDSPARRIDLLLTPEAEYPYALLYFTGSDKFNIGMRQGALELGYTMNEHGMKPKAAPGAAVPKMKEESDIFDFLGYVYVPPTQRTEEGVLRKK